jgi:aminoglycoside phosphotransferase (APT) family kinase protein
VAHPPAHPRGSSPGRQGHRSSTPNLWHWPTGPHAGPATLIGKFPSKDATSREFGHSSGYYRSEIGFYNELAPTLPVSAPTALHAALDSNGADFLLVMEDLAPARQVDQLVGCSADQSALALEQAAALHAATWHNTQLAALPWMQGPVNIFNYVTTHFASVIKTFPELCGDLVPEADLQEAAKLVGLANAWQAALSTQTCLWHSDFRADNLLFDADGGRRPVVVLDWQSCGFGPGTMDIALWLGTSMTLAQRRLHERALVSHYHQALLRHGVTGYSAEQCWDDYRLHAVHGLQVGVFGLGAVKRTPRGDQMWKTWIERTAAQVRDLDSFSLLAQRG